MISPAKHAAKTDMLSPERVALARAIIASQTDSRRPVARKASAEAVTAGRAAVGDERAAIAQSKTDTADLAVSLAPGDATYPPIAMAATRGFNADAQANCNAAVTGGNRLPAAAGQSGFGDAGLQLLHVEAVNVLRSEATADCAALAIEIDGLQRVLARKGAELLELVALGVFPPDQLGTRPNQNLSAVIVRLQTPQVLWRD